MSRPKQETKKAMVMQFASESGKLYQLFRTEQIGNDWEPVGSPMKGTGEMMKVMLEPDSDSTFYMIQEVEGDDTTPPIDEGPMLFHRVNGEWKSVSGLLKEGKLDASKWKAGNDEDLQVRQVRIIPLDG